MALDSEECKELAKSLQMRLTDCCDVEVGGFSSRAEAEETIQMIYNSFIARGMEPHMFYTHEIRKVLSLRHVARVIS